MNRIDDERVVFYLKHQQRIDEWAALAGLTSDIAHAFLCSCEDDLNRLATELKPIARTYVSLDKNAYPKLMVCSPKWFPKGDTEAPPMVAIGLEWHRTRTLGFTGPSRCAYAGVWVNYGSDGGSKLQGKLTRAFKAAGLIKQHALETSMWWPAYRWEAAPEKFWTDLSPYRAQLLDAIRFFWTAFEPIIREALSG